MQLIPASVQRLIDELARLPGVGPRTAERLTFYLVRSDANDSVRLGEALINLKESLKHCSTCFNLIDQDSCPICSNPSRSQNVIAVVEEPLDVVALEKTGMFRGLYHVLGGAISPIDGVGPDQLQIASLLRRVQEQGIEEIILATNPSTEGEATAMYIKRALADNKVLVTRLARGLPVGGDLEYADQVTLGRALQGRQKFD